MSHQYRIRHTTEYQYAGPVSHCYNLAYVIPRNTDRQQCLRHQVLVSPLASVPSTREDYFGNAAYHFEIQRNHQSLSITATSEVVVAEQQELGKSPLTDQSLASGLPWEASLSALQASKLLTAVLAREYVLNSPMIPMTSELKSGLLDYVKASFPSGRPLLAAVRELTERIFTEFTYCPESTSVATPLSEVLENKRGVCQDFAHLQIACLRALGLPARYVSGYLETLPPSGQEKLVGSDATHAWIAVYVPNFGWVEFDPTNNCLAGKQHIVTAWGRDYYDVTPLKGVIFGGGESPVMTVSVDVARLNRGGDESSTAPNLPSNIG